MKSAFILPIVAIAMAWPLNVRAAADSFQDPDSLVLKDGRTVRGLIVKNSASEVILQERQSEITYSKSEIVRNNDLADDGMEFTNTLEKDDLPSWRVIVNDLRTHDNIKSFVEIPAVKVDVGVFRNVPYKSFRINDHLEFNIYGDPENPAGMEMGIYGRQAGDKRLQTKLRAYFAGFLTTRAEMQRFIPWGWKRVSQKPGTLLPR